MPESIKRPPDFEGHLVREVGRILGDPAFRRAPILSRLLQYLREETIQTDLSSLSQFAIAVDGLGRNEDYDKLTESYPRVQISRLRKALADYYTRNLSGEGLCVFIRHGDYALQLAPQEIAYPDLLQSHSRNGRGIMRAAESVLKNGKNNGERSGLGAFNIAFGVLALLLIAATFLFYFRSQADREAMTAAPRIALNVQAAGIESDAVANEEMRSMVESVAGNAITFSPFSRIGRAEDAQYVLNISLSFQPSGQSEIYLNLSDMNAHVIFKKSFPITEDKGEFLEDVSDNLVDIFSTNSVLSREIFKKLNGSDRTDFECFVLTEADYAKVYNLPAMVHRCLDRFPESPYAVYWYARASFIEYVKAVRQGEPIGKAGPGWENLQKALEVDRFNPYANSLAGRVELTRGDCRQARFYFSRTMSQAYIYQGLRATVLAEEYPCLTDAAQKLNYIKRISRLVANNRDPDPPLKLYLMIAALVMERQDLAREVAEMRERDGMAGYELSRTIYTLSHAIQDSGFAQRKRWELEATLNQFLWNPASRAIVLRQLYKP